MLNRPAPRSVRWEQLLKVRMVLHLWMKNTVLVAVIVSRHVLMDADIFIPKRKLLTNVRFAITELTKGLDPACMEICPTGARIYGDLNDKESDLVKFLKENNSHVLKPHMNTGSKLYYNAYSQK